MYPSIIRLVDRETLEGLLGSNLSFDNSLLEKIFYSNHIFDKSQFGDQASHSLNLLFNDELGFEIPGLSGTKLLLNPAAGPGTEVPVSFMYSFPALKYVKDLSVQNISEDPHVLLDVLSEIFDVSPEELIRKCIELLIDDPDPVQRFVMDFNDAYDPAVPLAVDSDDPFVYLTAATAIFDKGVNPLEFIVNKYVGSGSFDTILEKLRLLLASYLDQLSREELLNLLIPSFSVSIDSLKIALEFPRTLFVPVETGDIDEDSSTEIGDPLPEEFKSRLTFDLGSVSYSTENGFDFVPESTFSFSKSLILNTGFTLAIEGLKLDLSRSKNIPEALADGRPNDFIGFFITDGSIGFPAEWGHDTDSSAELFVNNLLVGTGGISGTIGMRAVNEEEEDPSIDLVFGADFKVGLKEFALEFQQNAIVSSNIHGTLQIPGFKEGGNPAVIDINVHIGQDGEFNIVAAVEPAIKTISIPNAFDFLIESAFFGRETGDDGRFYLGISGVLDFTVQGAAASVLPDKLDIKKMLIYDDGTFEFEGGKLVLPKAYEVKMGAATISITGIHMGAYDRDDRKYKYFGFDGGVSTKPGGVEAQGKGIKFYYSVDELAFDWFIRLESLKVEIIIPSNVDPEDAAVMIKGFLSIAEPKIPDSTPPPSPALIEVLKSSQEYIGGVDVKIPKFKGLEASAAMRLNPKVPAFIIDLGIEISTPILLGTTGLGIYGFRALLGKKYVAEKTAAGIPADGEWWQYYKAKIEPDYKEGIQVSKFNTKDGFSFGAGVSLATATDSGKTFSSKLFFLLSLPDVFLFQGQAQFLKERIGLDANPDPPFYAIIAITKHSVEAGFGVNYKLRESGKLVTVDGVIELGFFWGSSSSWYVNIGRETPEDRRIQARLFDILNMYFYLMISSGGIRLGAGVKFELEKKFGPLSAELKAYIDTFGKISSRPRQIGGAIKMGGKVGIKVCGFGFSVSGGATLAAEAPKPHIITGEFEVCVKVLKKERCARFEFTWNFDNDLDLTRNPLLGGTVGDSNALDPADAQKVAKAYNMVTGETHSLAYLSLYDQAGAESPKTLADIDAPDEWIVATATDDFRIPVDSFIDLEFKKGVKANALSGTNLGKLGGLSTPSKFFEFTPPMRGKSDRVRHEYYLDDIQIAYWDELSELWKDYDFYNALVPMYDNATDAVPAAIDQDTLANLKWGYWQQQDPGINNKLRLLAMTPLSYASKTGNAYTIEDLGVNDTTIFCAGDEIQPTCVIFGSDVLYTKFPAGTVRTYDQVLFKVTQSDGIVLNFIYEGLPNGLYINPGDTLEIFFSEPMKEASLLLKSISPLVTITTYERRAVASSNPPVFDYTALDALVLEDETFGDAIPLSSSLGCIDRIVIETTACPGTSTLVCTSVPGVSLMRSGMAELLSLLIAKHKLTASVELFPLFDEELENYLVSGLYGKPLKSGDTVTLTQGHISQLSLSFTIADNTGFSCLYTFEMLAGKLDFDFSQITGVDSVAVYTADDHTGANTNFRVTFNTSFEGTAGQAQFLVSTCKPLTYCIDTCSTGLYKVCYLSLADYLLNQTVQETDHTADNVTMMDSISKTLQPIWRPNTAFAIRIKTSDRLYAEGQSSPLKRFFNDTVYGFRTAGPVGHYHRYPAADGSAIVQDSREDFQALDAKGRADEFRLTTLKSYIDYDKSYPNADSSLLNSKPLFYEGAKLRLFYLYNHVYHFYNDWADYDHIAGPIIPKIAESSLEIRILNPAPSQNPETTWSEGFEANKIDHTSLAGHPPALINSLNNDVSLLNNLLANGNPCTEEEPVSPIDISSAKVVDLKPLKLYTAQFVSHYNPRINGAYADEAFEATVHSYVFQTSHYRSFAEQVNSYVLKRNEANVVLKEAVFPLAIPGTVDFALAQRVITGELHASEDALKQQYADPFEQLIYGVLNLDIDVLQTANTTEFNLLHHNGSLIGILVRNPEPFNNPKIPAAVDQAHEQLEMKILPAGVPASFKAFYSKDHSQVFVTNSDFSFTIPNDSQLKFTFRYLEYNGVAYVTTSENTVIVDLDLTNYPL